MLYLTLVMASIFFATIVIAVVDRFSGGLFRFERMLPLVVVLSPFSMALAKGMSIIF